MNEPKEVPLGNMLSDLRIVSMWCRHCGKNTRPKKCKDPWKNTICGHCLKRLGDPIERGKLAIENKTKMDDDRYEEIMCRDLGVNSWDEIHSQGISAMIKEKKR